MLRISTPEARLGAARVVLSLDRMLPNCFEKHEIATAMHAGEDPDVVCRANDVRLGGAVAPP
ncbi:hypothetical protein NXT3_PA00049 (plasmid) [Sinorhizobium fredii]|uniref:Uncharacterized protein n=1 Tax=Rhizobium fredii TaxID=380 RepID=A0A2L0HA76_RHIFR|nr:hypothetical protein NXT3_PA00049 [Sinorhizobium fredii]